MNEKTKRVLAGTAAMLAGGAFGAGITLLLAPQSGKKTRRKIARYGRKVKNRSAEVARESLHSLAGAAEDLREQLTTRH